ncbi:MAG: hypothetical protein H6Q41_929, partial [Deltaproteobacteria bacterium]|nr:hypothetical protein [Deltaproteobacteria bacterium]
SPKRMQMEESYPPFLLLLQRQRRIKWDESLSLRQRGCIGSPYRDSMGIPLPLRNISPERDPHPPSSLTIIYLYPSEAISSPIAVLAKMDPLPTWRFGMLRKYKMAFLTFSRSTLVLIQGPLGRSFKIPITGIG